VHQVNLLALTGSLRAQSRNSALLRAAAVVAPANVSVTHYPDLASLPPFNPDLDGVNIPAVLALSRLVGAADGLLFACPEYAHGVPGALKNALDWLVAGEEFVHKPIALWNASPRATHAQAALAEIVSTMSGRIVTDACIAVPLLGTDFSDAQIAGRPEWRRSMREALECFAAAIGEFRALADDGSPARSQRA
jgi:NAD(P)H-dependent FMN reductase